MTVSPCAAVIEADSVAPQQLRAPVPGAHQIRPHRLTGANQVAQRFFLSARDTDRVKLSG